MSLKIIAAVSEHGVIGINGGLPWKLPKDMARFRQLTRFCPVIMGRKTFESIGKPLPDRKNIIVTSQRYADLARGMFKTENYKDVDWNFDVVGSVGEAISLAQKVNEENLSPERPIWIIGGGEIYSQTIDLVDEIHLTIVYQAINGDTYFPVIPDKFERNKPIQHEFYEDAGIECEYIVYSRKSLNAHTYDIQ